MDLIAQEPREETFRRMLRLLTEAKETAEELGLGDVNRLIEMAILGVAARWEGLDPETEGDVKLENLTRARVRQANDRRAGASVYRMEEWSVDQKRAPPGSGPKLVE